MTRRIALFAICTYLVAAPGMSRTIENVRDGGFNVDAGWTENLAQYSGTGDTKVFDETTNPGVLTLTYTNAAGSDETTVWVRGDVTLDEVGDFVQADMKTTGQRIGVCLAAATSFDQDRSNLIYHGIRSDGIIRSHAYWGGGNELGDADVAVPGGVSDQWVTVQIRKTGADTFQLYWGLNGVADTQVGGTFNYGNVSAPAGTETPKYPALMTDAGLGDFVGQFRNIIVGNINDPGVDNFDDGALSLNWDWNNIPQAGSPVDTFSLQESGGRLLVDYTNLGGDQVTFIARDNVTLQDGQSVVVAVRVTEGELSSAIGFGLGMATVGHGLWMDRSNTVFYVLRNDGLARANFFGNGGAEIGDPLATLTGYQLGDWVTLRIQREGSILKLYYGQGYLAEADQFVGQRDYSAHQLPTVVGLLSAPGVASFKAEAELFLVGDFVPVELSGIWVE